MAIADERLHASEPVHQTAPITGVQALNAGAVVIAGLYFGRQLLVPMVLAVLLAFVLAPLVRRLQRMRLGHTPSVLIAVVLAFAIIGGIGLLVGNQATNLATALPRYQATIQDKVKSLSMGGEVVERLAATARRILTGGGMAAEEAEVTGQPAAPAAAAPGFEAPSTLVVVQTVLAPLLGPLATAGIVVVFVVFVLMFREDMRDRLVRLVGRRDLHRTILAMNEAARRLSRFFLMQLALNTGFGIFITLALWACGLPNPLLWGILAGVMRFVPFIGSAIALIPPVLLALAVAPGWGLAIIVAAVILGSDMLMGQVVEPLSYGHSTGLSPFAIILSATFWAFMWGPIGLLLATPLTVCLVVIGRHVPALSFVHIMFSDSSPLEPEETFYQRALEGNQAELVAQAQAQIAKTSLADYFDRVALRGLALAQSDLSRDALAFDRLEAIHAHIEALLKTLAQTVPAGPGESPAPEWQVDGAVLCIPGRGQLDDLAAAMAVQALRARGYGARLMPNLVLGGKATEVAGAEAARLCCLSVLEEGSSAASVRYFLRRMQRRMPGAAAAVGLWHATAGSTTLAALRSEGTEEVIVMSLGELTALATAIAARAQPRAALPQPI